MLNVPNHRFHVPSLYVRVYRKDTSSKKSGKSSLIICEGISNIWVKPMPDSQFPHYM